MDITTRDAVYGVTAQQSVLAEHQAASLIQGLPPDPGAYADLYWLDECATAGARMRADIASGALPMPCTPRELLDWATTLGLELPVSFVGALPADAKTARASPPLAPTPATNVASTRHGGASKKNRDVHIHARAVEIVAQHVKAGVRFKKDDVGAIVAAEFGLSPERARRLISAAGIDWSEEKTRAAEAYRSKR